MLFTSSIKFCTNVLLLTGTLRNAFSLPLLVPDRSLNNPFVGFFVLPHGGVTLDPEHGDYSKQPAYHGDSSKKKAVELNHAMLKLAESLVKSKPDLIILSTPHGYSLEDSVLFLYGNSAAGTAGSIWKNFTAEFLIDKSLTSIMYSELKQGGRHSVDLMSLGVGGEQMDLLWAEVIPWHFIKKAAQQANFNLPKVIYIGQSPNTNNNQLENIGRDIVKTTLLRKEFAGKRIAVVISGDLSHLHSNDPASPYPYNAVSSVFDNHIVNWAKIDRNAATEKESYEQLFSNAGKIADKAGHCGYTGFVMMHGMMEEVVNQNWNYTSKFYTYQVPSYFGMVVTSWLPVN